MPSFPRRSAAPLAVPLVVAVALIAGLAGCVPTPSPSPTGSGASSSPAVTASATPSASPTPTVSATPITIGCSQLISADAIYAFNPNFGLLDSWTPASGSAAATAKSEKGIACRWSNQTSGDTIDFSVAHLDSASIESLKNDAVATSTMVPTYGDEAYFSAKKGTGTAIVFRGDFWLVASSVDFLEPGDPADLIDAALGALK